MARKHEFSTKSASAEVDLLIIQCKARLNTVEGRQQQAEAWARKALQEARSCRQHIDDGQYDYAKTSHAAANEAWHLSHQYA
jgi:hypothetical protein